MESVKVLQIVGYKNSGKTTLLSRWIQLAEQAGKKVAVLKHHGHGGPIDLPSRHRDSMKFLESGAVSSAVVDDHVFQLHMKVDEEKIEKLIELTIYASNPDFILIEGFKDADYEKVVLVGSEGDWEMLKRLTDIRCVIAETMIDHPTVLLRNSDEVDHWFYEWMGEEESCR